MKPHDKAVVASARGYPLYKRNKLWFTRTKSGKTLVGPLRSVVEQIEVLVSRRGA